jgi:hypothetical protein
MISEVIKPPVNRFLPLYLIKQRYIPAPQIMGIKVNISTIPRLGLILQGYHSIRLPTQYIANTTVML